MPRYMICGAQLQPGPTQQCVLLIAYCAPNVIPNKRRSPITFVVPCEPHWTSATRAIGCMIHTRYARLLSFYWIYEIEEPY